MMQFWFMSLRFAIYQPDFRAMRYDPTRSSTFQGGSDWNTINVPAAAAGNPSNVYGSDHNVSPLRPSSAGYSSPKPNFVAQFVESTPSPEPMLGTAYSGNYPQYTQTQSGGEPAIPSIPSMNAPRPMHNEYYDQDTEAVADYNPFDSDQEQDTDPRDEDDFQHVSDGNTSSNYQSPVSPVSPASPGSDGSFVVLSDGNSGRNTGTPGYAAVAGRIAGQPVFVNLNIFCLP